MSYKKSKIPSRETLGRTQGPREKMRPRDSMRKERGLTRPGSQSRLQPTSAAPPLITSRQSAPSESTERAACLSQATHGTVRGWNGYWVWAAKCCCELHQQVTETETHNTALENVPRNLVSSQLNSYDLGCRGGYRVRPLRMPFSSGHSMLIHCKSRWLLRRHASFQSLSFPEVPYPLLVSCSRLYFLISGKFNLWFFLPVFPVTEKHIK